MARYYNELYHFGIDGQKWGVRHGPPYPLSYNVHSARQKKQNPKRVIGGGSTKSDNKTSLATKNKNYTHAKKIAIATGVTVAAVLAGYGLYRTGALSKITQSLGKKSIEHVVVKDLDLGKETYKKLPSDHRTFDSVINEANPTKSRKNCFSVATATIGRMLGIDCTAKPASTFNGQEYDIKDVLDNLGVKETDSLGNNTLKFIREHDGTLNTAYITMSNQVKRGKLKNGDIGVISGTVRNGNSYNGHIFNWMIRDGNVIFGDGQQSYSNETLMRLLKFDKNKGIEWAKVANISDRPTEEILNGLRKFTNI